MRSNIVTSLNDENVAKLDTILGEIERCQEDMIVLVRKKRTGEITELEYNHKGSEIEIRINDLMRKRDELEQKSNTAKLTAKRVDEIVELIKNIDICDKFNAEIFKNIVDKVIVRNNYTLEFHLKVGITERIQIVRH